MNCINCKKYTKNNKFCSRSCSVTHNNKLRVKHGKYVNPSCNVCGKRITVKINNCMECHLKLNKYIFIKSLYNTKISDLIYKNVYIKSVKIRQSARKFWKILKLPKHCEVCGYTKHIEICHIKPISDFNLNDRIIDVNKPSNLIGLCPNCHWEFDNNRMNTVNLEIVKVICEKRTKKYL